MGGHIPALDGIRGLAVLLVVFTHLGRVLEPPYQNAFDPLFAKLSGTTWFGVDLFFVLSGFLITGILLDSKNSGHYFRNFYVRRALRIFPLYYGFLALIFVVLPALGFEYAPGFSAEQGWYWSYLSNVLFAWHGFIPQSTGYLWSLAVEEQFYLIWPLVVLLVSRERLGRICLGIIVAVFALRLAMVSAGATWPQLYVLTPTRMDALALGALIAVAARSERGLTGWRHTAGVVISVASIAGLLLMFYKPLLAFAEGVPVGSVNYSNLPFDLHVQTFRFTTYAIFFGALLVLTLTSRPESRLHRLFAGKLLRFFGRYSYAIYVLHVPIYVVAERYGLVGEALPRVAGMQWPRAILFFLLLTSAATAAAFASWHLYEKHFLKLKDRFSYDEPVRVQELEAIGHEREVFSSP